MAATLETASKVGFILNLYCSIQVVLQLVYVMVAPLKILMEWKQCCDCINCIGCCSQLAVIIAVKLILNDERVLYCAGQTYWLPYAATGNLPLVNQLTSQWETLRALWVVTIVMYFCLSCIYMCCATAVILPK